jgi:DNA-binding MarR family transcriptional regulator
LLWLTNKPKYVNMTDVIPETRRRAIRPPATAESGADRAAPSPAEELYRYVEALFFAYRDFTSEPDRILHEIGFGRAHQRVLHFVYRYPGMRVADLLDILQITKQSLARVLRELIKKGYIAQQSGKVDKRERLLYVTENGAELARRLVAPQLDKINGALASVGNDKDSAIARFLEAMVSDQSRFPYKRSPRATGQGGEESEGNR